VKTLLRYELEMAEFYHHLAMKDDVEVAAMGRAGKCLVMPITGYLQREEDRGTDKTHAGNAAVTCVAHIIMFMATALVEDKNRDKFLCHSLRLIKEFTEEEIENVRRKNKE